MSLITKINNNINNNTADLNSFNSDEIKFLLLLIKSSDFKGEHIEIIYNIIVKLQNQFLIQNTK